MSNLCDVVARTEADTNVLRALGYTPELVGGVLRVAALGGTTADVDIAILVRGDDEVIGIVLTKLGYDLAHTQDSKYAEETNGFLADYRKEDVNIILYNSSVYADVRELVSSFDLNINKYYLQGGVVCNDNFDGKVVVYTEDNNHQRHLDRITRFSLEYPELDWTQPKFEQERLSE